MIIGTQTVEQGKKYGALYLFMRENIDFELTNKASHIVKKDILIIDHENYCKKQVAPVLIYI
jgi:hypothetical protein